MKTIKSIKTNQIKRVTDIGAEHYVNNFSWIYVAKQEYKKLNKKETKTNKTNK